MPAVFAVKKSITGGEGQAGNRFQLCQAEDIAEAGMTIKRPKGRSVPPRTEVALSFALPGTQAEISARGVVVSDANAGSFRRTGVRFIAIGPAEAQLIAGYCRRQT